MARLRCSTIRSFGRHFFVRRRKIRAANLAEEREICEGSLIEFMIRAWPEVEPGELDVNWHHREIAAALEAITDGENRALIIT